MVRIMYGLTRWTSPCWLSIKFLCSLVHLVPKTREEGTLPPSSSVSFLFYIGCSGQGHTLLSFLFTIKYQKNFSISKTLAITQSVSNRKTISPLGIGVHTNLQEFYDIVTIIYCSDYLPSTNDHIIVPIFTSLSINKIIWCGTMILEY